MLPSCEQPFKQLGKQPGATGESDQNLLNLNVYDLLGYVRKLSIRIIIGVRINRVYELSEKIRYVHMNLCHPQCLPPNRVQW